MVLSSTGLQPDLKNQLSWSTAEIASGFGDHALAYAKAFPEVEFWCTEYDEYLVQELTTKLGHSGLNNVRQPHKLDVTQDSDWDDLLKSVNGSFDIVSCTNLLNVTPWDVSKALFKAVGRSERPVLDREAGVLTMYCCLTEGGKFLSESDEKFDAELKARDPTFGIRNLEDVVALAEEQGMSMVSKQALGGGTNQFLQFRFTQ